MKPKPNQKQKARNTAENTIKKKFLTHQNQFQIQQNPFLNQQKNQRRIFLIHPIRMKIFKSLLTEYYENNTKIYVADIQVTSAEYLKTAFAEDTMGKMSLQKLLPLHRLIMPFWQLTAIITAHRKGAMSFEMVLFTEIQKAQMMCFAFMLTEH